MASVLLHAHSRRRSDVILKALAYLNSIGVLGPQPCSQHAPIAPSEGYDRALLRLILFLDVEDQSSVVGQRLLDCEVGWVNLEALIACT